MKQTFKWAGLILPAASVGLALAVLVTAGVGAQSPFSLAQPGIAQATPGPYVQAWRYGPGMMGGSRQNYNDGGWGMDPGMMGGRMGAGYRASARDYPDTSTPLTLDQAVEAARQYLSAYGNPDLVLTEVMEFSDNFYAEVEEESTGVHAFELLVDRYSGAVYPEPGPNMMWNTKYGHMSGMMGGWRSQPAGPMTASAEQARNFAQRWLDQFLPGMLVAESADAFYGYYTIHVLKDTSINGMLSVNGYTGDIWYHTWHGDFVGMKALEE
jgi:hypothetical protein